MRSVAVHVLGHSGFPRIKFPLERRYLPLLKQYARLARYVCKESEVFSCGPE